MSDKPGLEQTSKIPGLEWGNSLKLLPLRPWPQANCAEKALQMTESLAFEGWLERVNTSDLIIE